MISQPNINETALDRGPIGPDRYRILRTNPGPISPSDISAIIDFNKLSDQYFLQDFYPNILAYDPQPDTYTELVKRGEAYTLSALSSISSEQFSGNGRATCPNSAGKSRERRCSMGRSSMRQQPAQPGCTGVCRKNGQSVRSTCRAGALNPDYSFFRFDSFQQFSTRTPISVGSRSSRASVFAGTYYSTTGNFTESDISNPIFLRGIWTEQGGRGRFALNTDLEASFKLSRALRTTYKQDGLGWMGSAT